MVMTASRSRNATRTMKKTDCHQDCGGCRVESRDCRRVLLPLTLHGLRLAHEIFSSHLLRTIAPFEVSS